MSVPKEQNAAVKEGFGKESTCKIKRVPVKEPGPGQILVKINWTGLCASDKQFILDEMAALGGKMAESAEGIAGHEGAGTVASVHPDVANLWKFGDRAGVKWCTHICGVCEFCTNGRDELHCPHQLNSALNVPGTFQEYVVTDAKYATSLGHLGIQYAKAMGMRVIAIDGGAAKSELCLALGAEHYIDFVTTPDLATEVRKLTTYGAHAVVVYASSKESYASAISLLRPRGIVIAVGVPGAPDAFIGTHPAMMAMGAYRTAGSVVGTLKEVDEALDFVKRGLVHPVLTKGTLADVDKYLALMSEGKVAGRVVLKVAA
nr:hypothetical protein B0A51_09060 [Rachicladosporium sp. CCFEE 5018]OQO22540.1 hypothetical protein B0A51_09015 [Rachicladosporium sp. CCFEE 5018]